MEYRRASAWKCSTTESNEPVSPSSSSSLSRRVPSSRRTRRAFWSFTYPLSERTKDLLTGFLFLSLFRVLLRLFGLAARDATQQTHRTSSLLPSSLNLNLNPFRRSSSPSSSSQRSTITPYTYGVSLPTPIPTPDTEPSLAVEDDTFDLDLPLPSNPSTPPVVSRLAGGSSSGAYISHGGISRRLEEMEQKGWRTVVGLRALASRRVVSFGFGVLRSRFFIWTSLGHYYLCCFLYLYVSSCLVEWTFSCLLLFLLSSCRLPQLP